MVMISSLSYRISLNDRVDHCNERFHHSDHNNINNNNKIVVHKRYHYFGRNRNNNVALIVKLMIAFAIILVVLNWWILLLFDHTSSLSSLLLSSTNNNMMFVTNNENDTLNWHNRTATVKLKDVLLMRRTTNGTATDIIISNRFIKSNEFVKTTSKTKTRNSHRIIHHNISNEYVKNNNYNNITNRTTATNNRSTTKLKNLGLLDLVIHVGPPKTATSTIQHYLTIWNNEGRLQRYDQYIYLGKFVSNEENSNNNNNHNSTSNNYEEEIRLKQALTSLKCHLEMSVVRQLHLKQRGFNTIVTIKVSRNKVFYYMIGIKNDDV